MRPSAAKTALKNAPLKPQIEPLHRITCTLALNEGGALEDPQTARRELSHAIVVAILHCGGNIVGVGATKRARPGYAKRIAGANKSGLWIKSK
jgi:hypothetical protein